MTDFQKQFFARLHIEEKDTVSFEDLSNIMYAMAQTVPFENLNILEKNFKEISKENLKEKILVNNRGGLCYELNTWSSPSRTASFTCSRPGTASAPPPPR